jgi:hypothetical protein
MRNRPAWYIKNVQSKIRHSWTIAEKEKIYTLRVAGTPVDDIIRIMKLKVGRIPIYNILRVQFNQKRGQCSCGTKLTPEEIKKQQNHASMKCSSCLEKIKELRKNLRIKYNEKGLCIECGKRRAISGHKKCQRCISIDYRRSCSKGFCGRCHVNPINKDRSISLCNDCLDHNKGYKKYKKPHV